MKRNPKKVELPPKFAQKLLDSEIQFKLSDTPSKQIVKQLIELYTIGVEYYQSIRSHKYLYFQMKMNEIFTSAATMTAINDKSLTGEDSPIKKNLNSLEQEQKIQALQIKHKHQIMFQRVAETTSDVATVTSIKKMINENDLKNIETSEKVKKEIQNQDIKLQQKLNKRKSRLLFSKSFSSSLMGDHDTQDTLFTDFNHLNQRDNTKSIIKPIQVSFTNVINQNQSDDDQPIKHRQRRLSTSQDNNKFRNQINLKKDIQSSTPI